MPMVPRERGRLLARIADALEARVEELARTIAIARPATRFAPRRTLRPRRLSTSSANRPKPFERTVDARGNGLDALV
jgi:hypothetical protein